MIIVTEIIQSRDHGPCSFKDTIRKKINSLEKRKTWKEIPRSGKRQNENVLGGMFVL